eukprot:TRINITY_DN4651_c0_g2_i1.p1 TRINITY_DN4651_c0_g2~~TRINITY_DN4651_c0_g2_i1.p1  ORF type:complete len:118 (+),score=7.84 TRINITY_DN4651_c0_g2_i1:107-460(+)
MYQIDEAISANLSQCLQYTWSCKGISQQTGANKSNSGPHSVWLWYDKRDISFSSCIALQTRLGVLENSHYMHKTSLFASINENSRVVAPHVAASFVATRCWCAASAPSPRPRLVCCG